MFMGGSQLWRENKLFFIINRIFIQFREIQELAQRHVEGHSNLMQRVHLRVLTCSPDDIVNGGLLQTAQRCQPINSYALLIA